MKNKKIAILGASSHIAKGLIFNFMHSEGFELFLFARFPEKVKKFLKENNLASKYHIYKFERFFSGKYDVVINCVGLGTPIKVKQASGQVFKLTEDFDNLSLAYLLAHPKVLYIN